MVLTLVYKWTAFLRRKIVKIAENSDYNIGPGSDAELQEQLRSPLPDSVSCDMKEAASKKLFFPSSSSRSRENKQTNVFCAARTTEGPFILGGDKPMDSRHFFVLPMG
jgi:hypothetical protein